MASSIAFMEVGFKKTPFGQPFFDLPSSFVQETSHASILIAGFLVGIGTNLGNGCTSGHGVCGIPRFSIRSIVAVVVFMATGIIMANLKHYFLPLGSEHLPSDFDPKYYVLGAFLTSFGILVVNAVANNKGVEGITDIFVSFVVGLLFAVGLMIAGMSRKSKIMNFLTFTNDWDVSLMFVMVGAILGNVFTFNYILRIKKKPILAESFSLSKITSIDKQLVTGAALFGIGWGLGGLCPGPAMLVAPIYHPVVLVYFIPTLALGTKVGGYVSRMLAENEISKTKLS